MTVEESSECRYCGKVGPVSEMVSHRCWSCPVCGGGAYDGGMIGGLCECRSCSVLFHDPYRFNGEVIRAEGREGTGQQQADTEAGTAAGETGGGVGQGPAGDGA